MTVVRPSAFMHNRGDKEATVKNTVQVQITIQAQVTVIAEGVFHDRTTH